MTEKHFNKAMFIKGLSHQMGGGGGGFGQLGISPTVAAAREMEYYIVANQMNITQVQLKSPILT